MNEVLHVQNAEAAIAQALTMLNSCVSVVQQTWCACFQSIWQVEVSQLGGVLQLLHYLDTKREWEMTTKM